MYWQNHELMMRNQQDMLNQIQTAYYLLHEHCPSCGARLKAPPEVRQ
jgi:rRNA maturation protein Nop10